MKKKEVPAMKRLFPCLRFFKRLRLVRHVRMVARIRDCNSCPDVKAACTELLLTLVQGGT